MWLNFYNQSQSECTLSHLFEHLNLLGTKLQSLRFGNLSPSHSLNVEFEPIPLAFITSGDEMKRLNELLILMFFTCFLPLFLDYNPVGWWMISFTFRIHNLGHFTRIFYPYSFIALSSKGVFENSWDLEVELNTLFTFVV